MMGLLVVFELLMIFALPITWAEQRPLGGAPIDCEFFAQASVSSQGSTDRWIALMEHLKHRLDILSPEQYMRWLQELSLGQIESPIQEHGSGLQEVMWARMFSTLSQGEGLDIERIRARAEVLLAALGGESFDRAHVQADTSEVVVRARFVDSGIKMGELTFGMPPIVQVNSWQRVFKSSEFSYAAKMLNNLQGAVRSRMAAILQQDESSFKKREIPSKKVRVVERVQQDFPDRTIEIMQTPFTQGMWTRLLGWNPSLLGTFRKEIGLDYPVTDVSLMDIMILLIFLNDHKIPIEQKQKVIPDHQLGDWYDLPTPEFLGRILDLAFLDPRNKLEDISDLGDRGWFSQTAQYRLQQVRTLLPIYVNDHAIYDLIGNVKQVAVRNWQFLEDFDHYDTWNAYLFRTGASTWSNQTFVSRQAFMQGVRVHRKVSPTHAAFDQGFRLVRVRNAWEIPLDD